jgi:hypothetical protein
MNPVFSYHKGIPLWEKSNDEIIMTTTFCTLF